MAQNQNNKTSEGVCEKFYNALSSSRKISLLSHHVHGSVSSKTAPKSQVQTGTSPAETSLLGSKPVLLNQPSHRMIPIEFEPSSRPSPMSQKENMQPAIKNSGKDDGTKRVSHISVQEIVINGDRSRVSDKLKDKTHGQVSKVNSMKDRPPSRVSMEGKTKLKGRMASILKTKSSKDDVILEKGHEGMNELKKENDKFSNYIDYVKNKMGTASNVGRGGGGGSGCGGGVGRIASRRDSFNNRVSSYIKNAKMKIRTTTNFDGKSTSFK